MKTRRDRLIRAAALTDTLWRLEASRGMRIEKALAEVDTAERAAMELLAHSALPPSLPLQQLQFAATRKNELKDALTIQKARTAAQGQRAKQVEKLAQKVEGDYRRSLENDERQRISERAASANVSAR